MDELVKALKNFIVRDIIYIIGGASVILGFLCLLKRMDIVKGASTVSYLYVAGISWVIGYCVQELFSLLHIVTTSSYFNLPDYFRWLLGRSYERLVGEPWEVIFPDIPVGPLRHKRVSKRLHEADMIIREKASVDNKADRERIISLMMVGTTIGLCAFLSSFLIVFESLSGFSNSFYETSLCFSPT